MGQDGPKQCLKMNEESGRRYSAPILATRASNKQDNSKEVPLIFSEQLADLYFSVCLTKQPQHYASQMKLIVYLSRTRVFKTIFLFQIGDMQMRHL